MFLTPILFLIGFYILIKGAGWLVDGSIALARTLRISNLVIGLVIAGIGTSVPEFAVTFIANLTGAGDVGIGTVIGSNTFNILFILGVSALFFPLTMRPHWVHRDLMWNIISVLVVAAFVVPFAGGVITRLEGVFLLLLFFGWLWWSIAKSNHYEQEEEMPTRIIAFPIAIGLIFAGFLGVLLGGKWVVDGAVLFARELGMGEALIGLTIVGIGTSLPEFAVTFTAAFKRQPGIAVGNIIGSNIFDFLMIIGAAAVVRPIVFPPYLFVDIIITALSAAVIYGFMFMGEPYVLKRWQGLLLVLFYLMYAAYLLGRGPIQ
ncbi:MAG: calcium/sodium antiporter [Candidatus Sungbacteria bacterium]|nr:calcium/sodium antiporter [Candidatus Sungbacteria bacterium]